MFGEVIRKDSKDVGTEVLLIDADKRKGIYFYLRCENGNTLSDEALDGLSALLKIRERHNNMSLIGVLVTPHEVFLINNSLDLLGEKTDIEEIIQEHLK